MKSLRNQVKGNFQEEKKNIFAKVGTKWKQSELVEKLNVASYFFTSGKS